MSKTPLLTVRCPQDIIDGITTAMNATGQNKTEVVVDMLRNSVPSLRIMERAKLPKVAAIYFVITPSNKLLYIGQSKNLFNRWLQHHRYQQFIETSPDSRVVWFEFDDSERESIPLIEGELIKLLDSEYNWTQTTLNGSSKAIGLRIPLQLWEQVSNYGYENFSKSDDEKDFDITATLLELIGKGLGNDSVEQTDIQTVEQIVKNIVNQNTQETDEQSIKHLVIQTVEQQFDNLLNIVDNRMSDQLNAFIAKREDIEQKNKIAIANQIASLKNDLNETIEQKLKSIVSELETGQDYDIPTITKINKKSLAPIIDDKEELPTQIDKSSLEPIFDDDLDEEEDVDWNELKVGELRKVITIKGLGNKFREKLRKSPRESKKAEIVKFLSETSIFDLD